MNASPLKMIPGGRIAGPILRRPRAFTLVELLVVVSIIALLISILLPSLKKARDQAKQVKCLANLSGLAKGHTAYGAEWNGWFLGSPATTGQQLFPRGVTTPPAATDVRLPGDVVQIWDWAGPIAALSTSLHWNRAERWRTTLITGAFECPTNQYIAGTYDSPTPPDGEYDGFGPQRMVSYNTMRAMMTRSGTAPAGTSPDTQPEIYFQYFHPQVGGSETLPASYEPRLDRVGNPSEKIFLADGSRYTDVGRGIVDYDYDWKGGAGGAFSSNAPTAPDGYLASYVRSSQHPQLAPYAYRHPNGPKLGLMTVYFDGHGEWMSEAQSRWPDPWWPKGTVIPIATEMNYDTRLLCTPYHTGTNYIVRR